MQRVHQFDVYYAQGNLAYHDYVRVLLTPLARFPKNETDRLLKDYLQQLQPLFRPWMMERVAKHRRDGYEVLLATAANSFLAEPIAAAWGFTNLVCTPAEFVEGRPTGEIIGEAAYREGKVEKIKSWIETHAFSLNDSWGYSDSHNDIPFLNLVKHPVVVTPDEKMRSYAIQKGWSILEDQCELVEVSKERSGEIQSS
jgi:HAD superfamily hydrolase (TIGR01490 family)